MIGCNIGGRQGLVSGVTVQSAPSADVNGRNQPDVLLTHRRIDSTTMTIQQIAQEYIRYVFYYQPPLLLGTPF
jgi:hypothetical protein